MTCLYTLRDDRPEIEVQGATGEGRAATRAESAHDPEIRTIVLGIMLAMFLGALDQTIVATALPTIGRHFGNLDDLSWVVTAYLLTGTAVTPLTANSPISTGGE